MARRFSIPDPKFAPKNLGEVLAEGPDSHHEKTLALAEHKLAKRSTEFRQDAVSFLNDWHLNQPEGFRKDSPGELVLAAIMAVSIRRGMQGLE